MSGDADTTISLGIRRLRCSSGLLMTMTGSLRAMEGGEKESAPVSEEGRERHLRDEADESEQLAKATDPPPSRRPSPSSATIQEITNRVLQFLSTASNETLGACVVGLCASTYLVLGRAGLLLLGEKS